MGAEIYDARIRPSGINKTGLEIHYFNKIGINKIINNIWIDSKIKTMHIQIKYDTKHRGKITNEMTLNAALLDQKQYHYL